MNTPEPVLKRTIGLAGAAGFGLGAMVGTGVFVTAGIGAGLAGPAVLLSLLIAGGAAACNGLASAELAMAHPRSGATYEYASRRLAPWTGALAGWLFLASKAASAAAGALAFGAYVGGPFALAVSFALVAAVTALALFGLGKAGAFNLVLVAVALGSLAAFAVTELPGASTTRFTPFAPGGVEGILTASSLLFVAYAGFGRVATLGEEIDEPRRNIPRALILSLGIAVVVYLLVTAVALGVEGAGRFGELARAGAPLEALASRGWVRAALSVGAAAAIGSAFLNLILGISRMAFAMARGGHLPGGLAQVNASSSPWVSVLLTGALVAALVAVRRLELLLTISAFAVLLYYAITNLSALRLSPEERLVPPAVPWAGLLSCLALAAAAAWRLAA
jgi:APA family basic amino acid/polyamine antiporter